MEGSNPSLSCKIDSSEIAVNDFGSAFFKDITVTLNGDNFTLLNTLCRARGSSLYTVMCYHDDHTIKGIASSEHIVVILTGIIIFLIVSYVVIYSKLKRELAALKKESANHGETENLEEENTSKRTVLTWISDENGSLGVPSIQRMQIENPIQNSNELCKP